MTKSLFRRYCQSKLGFSLGSSRNLVVTPHQLPQPAHRLLTPATAGYVLRRQPVCTFALDVNIAASRYILRFAKHFRGSQRWMLRATGRGKEQQRPMNCPHCQSVLPDASQYCNHCSQLIPANANHAKQKPWALYLLAIFFAALALIASYVYTVRHRSQANKPIPFSATH